MRVAPVDDHVARLQVGNDLFDKMIHRIAGLYKEHHLARTFQRQAYVESKGLLYVGRGVSGGEEGALNGPSMMPGGSAAAWELVRPIFQSICARADGQPCCEWVGENGAGHFVKMVHNGIEYGDMQLICETYQLMKDLLGLSAGEMHEVFKAWNGG